MEEGGQAGSGVSGANPGAADPTIAPFLETPDLRLNLGGEGGYPSLHIRNTVLEFVPAMLYCTTTKTLRLFNNGSAEAMVTATTMPLPEARTLMASGGPVSALRVRMAAGSVEEWPLSVEPANAFIVKARAYRDIHVAFEPTSLEHFTGALVIHQQGEEGDAALMLCTVVGMADSPLLSVQVRWCWRRGSTHHAHTAHTQRLRTRECR